MGTLVQKCRCLLVLVFLGFGIASGQSHDATLTWTAPGGVVTGYNVYRSTVAGGSYILRGSVSTSSFVDTSVTSGITYYYVVTAYNSGGESAYSNEVSATIPGAPASFTFSVSKTGGGTITSAPAGISCGVTCSGSFPSGSSVTLTEAPASGYTFGGWNGSCSGTATTCTVTMASSLSASATFTFVPVVGSWILAVTKSGAGTGTVSGGVISCGPTCSGTVSDGVSVVLTATPTAGSAFNGWTGDCSGTGTCSFTMDSDKSVTASFGTAQINKSGVIRGKASIGGKVVVN